MSEQRALVLSGGGSKGPFHVGAVQRLIGELGIHYPILCGVSVGAMVAGFLAMYPKGDEAQAALELDRLFLSIRNRDVWKHWKFFRRAAALWKPSILNTAPLQELVKKRLDGKRIRDSGKKLRIGAVSLTKGNYQVFTEETVPLHLAILASSAFPGFFTPIHMADQWWTDGGVQHVTPIKSAIKAGATAIDVVITEPREASPGFNPDPDAPDVLLRSLELMVHQLTWADVKHARMINVLVEAGLAPGKRHVPIRVISPDSSLNGDSLNFDPEEAVTIAGHGYRKAVELEDLD